MSSDSNSNHNLEAQSSSQNFSSSSTYKYNYTVQNNEFAKIRLDNVPDLDYESVNDSLKICMNKLDKARNFRVDQSQIANCIQKIKETQNNFLNTV